MQTYTASASNRRRELRCIAKGWTKATCRKGDLDLGKDIAIRILDVAATGARFLVRELLESNQELTIHLETPRLRRPLRVFGKVMWCVETAEHNYCVGVVFQKRMSSQDLAKLT